MAKGKQLLFNLGEDTHHLSGGNIFLHVHKEGSFSLRRDCERQCGMPEMALVLWPHYFFSSTNIFSTQKNPLSTNNLAQ